jgi:hypothetical protein
MDLAVYIPYCFVYRMPSNLRRIKFLNVGFRIQIIFLEFMTHLIFSTGKLCTMYVLSSISTMAMSLQGLHYPFPGNGLTTLSLWINLMTQSSQADL